MPQRQMLSLGSAVQPLSMKEEMGLSYSFGDAGTWMLDMDGNLEADRLNSKSFLSFQSKRFSDIIFPPSTPPPIPWAARRVWGHKQKKREPRGSGSYFCLQGRESNPPKCSRAGIPLLPEGSILTRCPSACPSLPRG